MYVTIMDAAVRLNMPPSTIEKLKNKPELKRFFIKKFHKKTGRMLWHIEYDVLENWLLNDDFYYFKYLSPESKRGCPVTSPRPPKTQGELYKMFLKANYTAQYEESYAR